MLRVVVRNGMSRDMAGMLVNDLKSAVSRLEQRGAVPPPDGGDETRAGFHH